MPTVWSPPKTPQFLRSGGGVQPPPTSGLTVEIIPTVNIEDLVAGTGEWNNLQKIIRFTFKSLIDSVTVQHGETGRLHEYIKHMSQTVNSKVDKRLFDEMRGDVMRACTGVAQLQEDVRHLSEAKGVGRGQEEVLQRLEEKATLSFVKQGLESKLDRFQWETHRSEMASKLAVVDLFEKRMAELDGQLSRFESLMTEVARREAEVAMSGVAAKQAQGSEETTLALSRRVELLQSELCRLARVVDQKADSQEVEAALRLKASKASVQKRLVAVAEEDEGVKDAVRKLKTRVEGLEGTLDGMGRRSSEQESALRRVSIDVEAMRGRPRSQESQQSTNGIKALEGLAYQTAKKTSKLEKEATALADKLKDVEQELASRPTQAALEDISRAVNDGVKTLEDDIFKELEARDEEIKQRSDDTMHLLQQLEEKMEATETMLHNATYKAEGKGARGEEERKESIEERVSKVEARCELLTPERVASVVSDALRDVEASKLVQLSRQRRRRDDDPSSSPTFKDVLRRLDNLDFDVAHAGMLFKVLQEVVCDALGALEGTMLQHMGSWADDGMKKGEEAARRLADLERRLEHDAIRRLEALQQELRQEHPITTQRVQALIEDGLKRQQASEQEPLPEKADNPRSRCPSLTRSLYSQRSRAEAFDPSMQEGGMGGDDASTATGPTRRGSTDRRTSQGEASLPRRPMNSQSSRLPSGSRSAEARTPTPRSVLGGLVDLEAGGGGDFQEIVLRRLDLLEREMEKMQDEQGRAEGDGEGEGRGSPSLCSVMVEQRLNAMEHSLHDNSNVLGDIQDQLLDAKSQLRGLRLDHDQGTAGLAARVQAVEERVARGVLSLGEDKAALEHALHNLQAAMDRLKDEARQRSLGSREGGYMGQDPQASSGGKSEAMRRLEEQVLACQEQIQSRMTALKARMEQPIEGFAKAVAVMSEDLRDVKRKIAAAQQQQQQQQEQSDSRSGGGSLASHPQQPSMPPELSVRLVNLEREGARSTHALETRIATLEQEAATLSQQLRHVTHELYTVNREVERLVAVSPVPLPPLNRTTHAPPAPSIYPTPYHQPSSPPPSQAEYTHSRRVDDTRHSRAPSHVASQPSVRRAEAGSFEEPRGGDTLATDASVRGSWVAPSRPASSSASSFSRRSGEERGPPQDTASGPRGSVGERAYEHEGRGRHDGIAEQRSSSSVSEVTMHSVGIGTKPPRPLARMSRDQRPGVGGGGGGEIREEDEEDEEVRTASDSAMRRHHQAQPPSAHFQEAQGQVQEERRSISFSRDSAGEGGGRVDSALSHATFTSVNQGRLSQLSGLDGGSMSSAVSQQEQHLDAIRKEKERLASLIPQLQGT